MVTRPRNVKPLSYYDPKYFLVFTKAAQEGLTIPCGEKNKAVALRHRLYSFRSAMRIENHPDYEKVSRVTIRLINDPSKDKGWSLICEPDAKILDSLLDGAQIEIPDIPDLEL